MPVLILHIYTARAYKARWYAQKTKPAPPKPDLLDSVISERRDPKALYSPLYTYYTSKPPTHAPKPAPDTIPKMRPPPPTTYKHETPKACTPDKAPVYIATYHNTHPAPPPPPAGPATPTSSNEILWRPRHAPTATPTSSNEALWRLRKRRRSPSTPPDSSDEVLRRPAHALAAAEIRRGKKAASSENRTEKCLEKVSEILWTEYRERGVKDGTPLLWGFETGKGGVTGCVKEAEVKRERGGGEGGSAGY